MTRALLLLPLLLVGSVAPAAPRAEKKATPSKVLRRNPNLTVKVLRQRTAAVIVKEAGELFEAPEAGFLVLTVKVTNRGKADVPVLPGTFYLEAKDGRVYSSWGDHVQQSVRFKPLDTVVRPRGTAEGEIAFLVRAGTKGKRVEYFPAPEEAYGSRQ
jgi:hypothetical protein